ncbi:MAG TPA: sensor domain-containing diguanylate cyclase [Baekduia sp.]|nr:sensor domain-containing diguanylate cyclase [Baekduia sp.]
MGVVSDLISALPRGRTLPVESWRARHAWMVRVLWAHVVGLLAWGLLLGDPAWHAAVDVAPIAISGAGASYTGFSRRGRAALVCIGLLTCSALVVHLMNGAIEGHFHFFVMVTLVALYEEWFPYLLAIAFVAAHHGLTGLLQPGAVFNHPAAIAHPWRWASIHALFITALGVVNLVSWRMHEDERERTAQSKERLRWAFEDAPTGMAFVDLDGRVQRVNAALCRTTGFRAAELVGEPLARLVFERDGEHRGFPSDECREGEWRYRRRDMTHGWALWHHSLVVDGGGAPLAWVSHCLDISERKDAEELLAWRATHDALTGLPNREHFLRHLGDELARRQADPGSGRVTLLFLDIDDFKDVNDSLGHEAGDRLLIEVAARLREALRPEDLIARFGGDEFTVLLSDTPSDSDVVALAARLGDAVRRPVTLDGAQVQVSASVGLAFTDADQDPADPDVLLRDADAAMYYAKGTGKNRLEQFDGSMRDGGRGHVLLERPPSDVLDWPRRGGKDDWGAPPAPVQAR